MENVSEKMDWQLGTGETLYKLPDSEIFGLKRQMDLISVIIPVYNVEKYLDKCLSSIVQQTYHDLEILLIDDGSTDHCGKLCDEWAEKDPRIQVVHTQNAGVSNARNIGLETATGKYIYFVDSDDYLEQDTLTILVNSIEESCADMAVCNFEYEFETEEVRMMSSPKMTVDYQVVESQILSGAEFLKMGDKGKYALMVANWNKLYRKELFYGVRYSVGMRYEDEKIIHRLVYPCKRISVVPFVGYHYEQHSKSFMHGNGNLQDYIDAFLDRCMFLTENNERELALTSEGRLLSAVKRATYECDRKQLKKQKNAFFAIVWKMYRKKWLPFSKLCKRWILCKVL